MRQFLGVQKYPIGLFAASQLERNRVVKISATNVPSYAARGEVADGYTTVRGNETDYMVAVTPFVANEGSFFLLLAGTVAAGAYLFPAGTTGAVKTNIGNVKSRSVPAVTGTEGDKYIVPANIDWESGSNQNKVATKGASAWAYAVATSDDIYYVEDEGIYVVWNGTAWVEAIPCARALEEGVATEEIACYLPRSMARISWNQLASTVRDQATVVVAGLSASETDADATVTISDERIKATDYAVATLKAAANAVYVTKAVCTARTLTITLSGNGGAGTVVNYAIYRSAS